MRAGNTSLTTEQQIARLRFEALVTDIEHADALYDALPESQGGRVISTDIARYLDLTFHVHTPGRLRDLVPSWEGAWRYAQGRLYRELMRRKKRKVLRLMAGGWASGKTYALSRSRVADLTWDGTLSDLDWASETIELALKQGWNVEVAYVQRPILLALQGALERGVQEGRMVPLWELPAVHAKVQSSILALHNRFGLQSRVRFLLLYNPGTIERPQEVLKIAISDIASGGRLHYTPEDVKGFQIEARKIWEVASGDPAYSEEILEAAADGMVR